MEVRKRWLDDVTLDEGTRRIEPAVKVKSGDDGLEGVGEQRGLVATAALLFAATEAKHGSQANPFGDLAEMTAADERGTQAGEFALASVWEETVETLGCGETEDGVADELQLLVVAGGGGGSVGIGLVGEGAMSEGEGKELGPAEAMLEEDRERLVRRRSC